jgi:hypothetical protein
MAQQTNTIIYKSFTGAGLPFYKQGTLKGFQLEGNYLNFEFDLIQVNDYQIPSFFTEYQLISNGAYISSLKLYELNVNKLKTAQTYQEMIACRGNYTSLPVASILKETKETYERYYTPPINLANVMAIGVYELVMTDSSGRIFESEVFSNCLFKETSFSNIVCSSASCPDVTTGNRPVFTITITETNGVPVEGLEMKVNWLMDNSVKFNDIVFPFRFGNVGLDTEETQTFNLVGGGSTVLTFTYPNIIPTGDYSMTYILNRGTCSGSIDFSIGNPCIEYVSGEWTNIAEEGD